MTKSLLTHIASNFISEYENVANSSIAYLLNEYSAPREALKDILEVSNVPTHYVTELSTNSNGRPDVTGLNIDGSKTVIIEGKFWANLTKNQPVNYLEELGDTGKLLFLAPDKRLSSLRLEIDRKLDGKDDRVIICSWINFLDLIERENNKKHDPHLASDLIQVKELCRKMDVEGMPPLSVSDLDPMNGRIASQFSDVIDECNSNLRAWEHSDFDGLKSTNTKYGYGFYFRAHKSACFLGLDCNKWFLRSSQTPIWLTISEHDFQKSERIKQALKDFDSFNSFDSDYGIVLQAGMDKDQVVEFIVNSTKSILEHLNTKFTDE